jgi:mono/diheme cytochrome c family protein
MKTLAQTLLVTLPVLFALPGDWVTQDKEPQQKEWKAPARAARKKNPIALDAKSIAAGRSTFQTLCAVCHGPKGKGNGPAASGLKPKPRDLSAVSVSAQTDGELYWKIRNGRSPMPAFSQALKKNQVWNVVHYVRTLAVTPRNKQSKRGVRKDTVKAVGEAAKRRARNVPPKSPIKK